MQPLDKTLRNQLERAIKSARGVAEAAARAALEQIGVGEAAPPAYLDDPSRALRRRLRAHGRQLGDALNGGKVQTIGHLVQEVAYQHWHRMLFARFLADNDLLMYDGVAVTLAECDELAPDEGAKSGWELAGTLAARMLPQIFRPDAPLYELSLPREHQHQLEKLLANLPPAIFLALDSLGWVYQFWQADNKDQINKSGVKIGADELPAVTQLFTEDYMVDFLLDNTLGAWHAGKVLAAHPQLAEKAQSEDELRQAVALPGCPWRYLRFIRAHTPSPLAGEVHHNRPSPLAGEGRGEGGNWTPAAGTFDGWPQAAKALRCLDPCMGSGHFVVALFERLVALRMAEENLDAADAVAAVIRDNLFGLEIDPRCTQIAAFNLALAAWRRLGHRQLPAMNLACSGLAPNTPEADWLTMAGDDEKLRNGMARLYRLFQKAAVLGSLINPRAAEGDLLEAGFHELQPLLEQALARETTDDTAHEVAVTARGLAKAAEILAGQFTLVATNVPYLGRGKQDEVLQTYCEKVYPESKADLATCFVERCLNFCASGNSVALVTPQNWLFLATYKSLRQSLLAKSSWSLATRLGSGAFGTISGEVVKASLVGLTQYQPAPSNAFIAQDVSNAATVHEKAEGLRAGAFHLLYQRNQLSNPDYVVTAETLGRGSLLSACAVSVEGLSTGDKDRFLANFWEVEQSSNQWQPFQVSPRGLASYDGFQLVVRWEDGRGDLAASDSARVQGHPAWGKQGVIIGQMTTLTASLTCGFKHDKMTAVIVPKNAQHLAAIYAFCSSPDYNADVRKLSQKLNVATATLVKVPFDLAHWQKVAVEKYPHGLPKPFSSDPTQWLFDGKVTRPSRSGSDNQPDRDGLATDCLATLQVAVARLLGYQWPRQTGSSFPDCPAFGPDGLEPHADQDGIVCIPPVGRESSASDRLLNLLEAAYRQGTGDRGQGAANPDACHLQPAPFPDWLNQLLANADHAGKSLETWLRDKFFIQHCKLFHNRPFIWHIWDGLRDGFAALVNYHKLDYKTLEALLYTYLGDWINRQRRDADTGVDGAQERLAAAEALKKRLELILAGEAPYDIFVRWKPLSQQPLGWHPDLNDGVRMNIRPFLSVPDVGRRGAGVLRDKPNIKWEKDRGSDVPSAPWYELGLHYGGKVGDRINDHHLTLAEKRAARDLP